MRDITYSEWELLCITDDIEQGDTLVVENVRDQHVSPMLVIFIKLSGGLWIDCVEPVSGVHFVFNAQSLYERGHKVKSWKIVRKSEVSLRLREKTGNVAA